jgi:aspartate/methionine/tyrosine aminotransferase
LAGDPDILQRAVTWREHQGLALASPATSWVKRFWPHRARIIESNQALLETNRRLVQQSLAQFPELHWHTTPATAVGLLGPQQSHWPSFDDEAFSRAVYTHDRVFVVPGSRIGYPGRLRIGYGQRAGADLSLSLAEVLNQLSSWLHSSETTEKRIKGAP